jgi:hypothetical protein
MPKYQIDVTIRKTMQGVVRVEVHADDPDAAEDFCVMNWDEPGRWPGGKPPMPESWTPHDDEVWCAEHIEEEE